MSDARGPPEHLNLKKGEVGKEETSPNGLPDDEV